MKLYFYGKFNINAVRVCHSSSLLSSFYSDATFSVEVETFLPSQVDAGTEAFQGRAFSTKLKENSIILKEKL